MYVASPWLSLLAPVQSLGAGRRRWLRVQRQSQRALFATVEVGAGGFMVTTAVDRVSSTRAGAMPRARMPAISNRLARIGQSVQTAIL